MQILLTNDDGIFAPGLKVAQDVALSLAGEKGKVITVAPSSEKSGVAHSTSYIRPSLIEKIGENSFSVEGTPADCVLAGIHYVMKENKPDLIISGINRGQNISEDVLYSGTVGAAMEGAINGIRSIALSQSYSKETLESSDEFDSARYYATKVCQKLLSDNPFCEKNFNGFYNVNFPACDQTGVRGMKVCQTGLRQDKSFSMIAQLSPTGKTFLWINHKAKDTMPSPKSDAQLLDSNYITISALKTEINWPEKNRELEYLFLDE